MLSIIQTDSVSRITEHARATVKYISDKEFDRHNPNGAGKPLGIPVYAAKYPVVCDDCNETYWANDPYASHVRCRGNLRGAGF